MAGSLGKISLGMVVGEHAGGLVKGAEGGTLVALSSSESVRWQVTFSFPGTRLAVRTTRLSSPQVKASTINP